MGKRRTTKVTVGRVTGSLTSVGGAFAGAMASRIVADKLGGVLKNPKVKHGVLAVVSAVGATLLDRRSNTEALGQDALVGFSATQLNALVKEMLKDKDTQEVKPEIMKTGLGTPWYLMDNYMPSYSYEVYDEQPEPVREIKFRS